MRVRDSPVASTSRRSFRWSVRSSGAADWARDEAPPPAPTPPAPMPPPSPPPTPPPTSKSCKGCICCSICTHLPKWVPFCPPTLRGESGDLPIWRPHLDVYVSVIALLPQQCRPSASSARKAPATPEPAPMPASRRREARSSARCGSYASRQRRCSACDPLARSRRSARCSRCSRRHRRSTTS